MSLAESNESMKNQILSYWCGPQDYLAMVAICKARSDAQNNRNAAFFAVSRIHFPGCESWHAMACWETVWKQCVELFDARRWTAGRWKNCCKVQIDGRQWFPQEQFFKGLNEMVATHINGDAVASVLAICVNCMRMPSINALVLLKSGAIVFLVTGVGRTIISPRCELPMSGVTHTSCKTLHVLLFRECIF